MAASMIVEEEIGSSSTAAHPHRGYYAGDFSGQAPKTPSPTNRADGPRVHG